MAFPADPLDVEVSLALGADLADPGSWSWTDITSYVRENNRIRIRRGRSSERSTFPPSRCTLVVDNTDGRFCRLNPFGTWYGQIGKNTPLRVRVDNGSGYVTRFVGYVSGWPPSWDPSERDQTVTLVADGILRRLGQGRVLRSALYRTMAGITPDDFQPLAYWPLEDESSATQFASAQPGGTPGAVTGAVSFAADAELVGSQPLPDFDAGASATFSVPSYTLTNRWIVQLMVKPTATTGSLFRVTTNGSGTTAAVSLNFSTNEIGLSVTDVAGGSLLVMTASIPDVRGQWVSVSLSSRQNVSSQTLFDLTMITDNGTSTYGTGDFAVLAAYGHVTGIVLNPSVAAGFGHVGVFVDPSFAAGGGDDVYNARAMGGWAGEQAHERIERLCREERVPVTVTATESQAMGPQPNDTLIALLRECATTDFGLLYEPTDAAGLAYLSSSERYSQAPAITLQYDQGHISPPWDPTDDDRETRNDVTVSRRGGSSVRVTDETSIAAIGVYDDTLSVNTETDAQLSSIAARAVSLGTVDELRWPAVKPNLLKHPALIDDWLTADLGSKLAVTGHPSPLAPQDIEQIIEGYDEVFGSFEYSVTANLSPASGWEVGVYGPDPGGVVSRYGAATTVLAEDLTSSETAADVTTGGETWVTTASNPSAFPFNVDIGGLTYSCTAITGSGSSYTLTLVRLATDKAHSAGAAVTVTDTGRYAP